MITLSIRDFVRNAAAVFTGRYGSVSHRAKEAGCSRQALYDQAKRIEAQLQPDPEPSDPSPTPTAGPTRLIDQATRVQFAVTAFAEGVSTRTIERLLRILAPDDGPDHATIGRWVAGAGKQAAAVLKVIDPVAAEGVQVACLDEVFFGGDRR